MGLISIEENVFCLWIWVLKADMYRQLGNDAVATLGDWCHS